MAMRRNKVVVVGCYGLRPYALFYCYCRLVWPLAIAYYVFVLLLGYGLRPYPTTKQIKQQQ
jgi:hypothetical protein